MNQQKSPWDELARLARSGASEPLPEMPFGFETRVLASLRETPAVDDGFSMLVALIPRALLFSALIAILTLAATHQSLHLDTPSEMMAQSLAQMTYDR